MSKVIEYNTGWLKFIYFFFGETLCYNIIQYHNWVNVYHKSVTYMLIYTYNNKIDNSYILSLIYFIHGMYKLSIPYP